MITSVQIKNFKSVVDLSLQLGTLNVLIGENGCGKSNILEAIAFGAAASADKLDYEFLGSRGIRAANPEFMTSAFSDMKSEKGIDLAFEINGERHFFQLKNDQENRKKWFDLNRKEIKTFDLKRAFDSLEDILKKAKEELNETKFSEIEQHYLALQQRVSTHLQNVDEIFFNETIANYIIYSPEQSSLRKFEETNQIYPLGIKGEGLFQYLKELASDEKNKEVLAEIKQTMVLLDWYEDFDLGDNLMSNEFSLKIKDKYLSESLQYFDQRSTNEGFLYLLFYATLFISKDTPTFFAIDNIDASFNPKLCMQVTKTLSALAKKHKKQVIVTTQNPAILDGLNLKDDEQRLFVIRRNEDGHTRANRIEHKAERKMKLSEVWTSGFIGGLPENF